MAWPVYEGDKSVMFFFFFFGGEGPLGKGGEVKKF